MEDIVLFKVISLVFIWIVGLVGGILPYFIYKTNATLMGYLSCFSGGVFLAGGFLHLFHGALENEGLKEWSEMDDGKYEFPYVELFCTIGFLAVFYIEQFSHLLQHSTQKEDQLDRRHKKGTIEREVMRSNPDEMPFLEVERVEGNVNIKMPKVLHEGDHQRRLYAKTSDDYDHSHVHFASPGTPDAIACVIFVALSFHSIMEGLGIGAQNKSAWGVFMAIIVHKGLAAFALGSGILKSSASKSNFFFYMFMFSLMSVIGIVIGWIIARDSSDETAAAGICLALASGTFIYVAVMEVIPQEFKSKKNIFLKSIFLFSGYAIFGALAKWA